jgi:hypothetical protein
MVMRMLYVGGIDVVANLGRISFEDDRASSIPLAASFIKECQGKAVKVLDPHRHQLPSGFRYRLIWLHREPIEQARSTLKFMQVCGLGVPQNRETRHALAASFKVDYRAFLRVSAGLNMSWLRLWFEDILAFQVEAATRLQDFVGCHLNIPAMADAVQARGPHCLPGMLELQTVEASRAGRITEPP